MANARPDYTKPRPKVDEAQPDYTRPRYAQNDNESLEQTKEKYLGDMRKSFTPEKQQERIKGLKQGIINVGKGYANLLPNVNLKKDKSANSPEAKQGEAIADIGSFFLPGGVFKLGKYLPGVKSAVKGLEELPKTNALLKIGKGTGENALSSAALGEKEKQKENAKFGGEVGLGMNTAAQVYGLRNPIVNALLRGTAGAGLGYGSSELTGQDPYKSAGAGFAAGAGLPQIGKLFGIGATQPGLETLKHLNPNEIIPKFEASQRLGRIGTPGELSGNPFVAGQEGRFKATGEAAALNAQLGKQKVGQEQTAIKDLLNTIEDRSTPQAAAASAKKVADLYDKAYHWNLLPNTVKSLKKDPVIAKAFKDVKKDVAYSRKLQGIPENNFAYLNQVKIAIDDMKGRALTAGDKGRYLEFKAAGKDLTKQMDQMVPLYKTARAEAQKGIIRDKMEKALESKEIKGSHFYSKILTNETKFNRLKRSLKNVPEAQDMLQDMRDTWKDLINLESTKSGSHTAEKGLSQSRSIPHQLMDMYNELTGSKRNVEALKFINSPTWIKGFDDIAKMKNKVKRENALAEMLGTLTTGKIVNKSQGSDKNGNNSNNRL